jgi:hypothetical protein
MIIQGLNGRITRIVFHTTDGDVDVAPENVLAIPGFYSMKLPNGQQHFPTHWRLRPKEPNGPELWYSGPWSIEFQESSIALAGPAIGGLT